MMNNIYQPQQQQMIQHHQQQESMVATSKKSSNLSKFFPGKLQAMLDTVSGLGLAHGISW